MGIAAKFLLIIRFVLLLDDTASSYSFRDNSPSISPIGNLNAYLNLFGNCLIHVINYHGLDFEPLETPVVLSKYFLDLEATILKNGTDWVFTRSERHNELEVLESIRTTSRTSDDELNKFGLMRSLSYNWKCRAQFYIHPPEMYVYQERRWSFQLPLAFRNFWNTHKFNSELGVFRTLVGNYHILIRKEGFNYSQWTLEMNSVRSSQFQTKFIILSTTTSCKEGIQDHSRGSKSIESITSAGILCQYCYKWAPTLMPIHPPLTRDNLDVQLISASQINNGVPWVGLNLNLELDVYTASAQKLMVRATQERKLNFRNLHDYSQSVKILYADRNLADDEKNHCLSDRTSVENVLLALAVPNITIDKSDWCLEGGGICGPRALDTPSVELNVVFISRALLPSPEEPLAFFTCGWEIPQRIQFRAFVSSYDLFTWITIGCVYVLLCILIGILYRAWDSTCPFTLCNMGFMGITVLLEQGDDLAGNRRKVGVMYWIGGSFLLAGVVLSNAYKGSNIRELTSPIPPLGLGNLSQLVDLGFKIYTTRGMSSERVVRGADLSGICQYLRNGGNGTCKKPVGDYQHFMFYNLLSIRSQLNEDLFKFFAQILYPRVAELLRSDLFPGGLNTSVKNSLKKKIETSRLFRSCNKTAFVGWWDLVEFLSNRLAVLNITGLISVVKDKHMKRQTGWEILAWEDDRIVQRLGQLKESGVADKWREIDKRGVCRTLQLKFEYSAFREKERKEKYARALSLKGNVHTVFIIGAGGLLICISCFLVEVRKRIWGIWKEFFFKTRRRTKGSRFVGLITEVKPVRERERKMNGNSFVHERTISKFA